MKVTSFPRQRPLVCAACLFAVGIWLGKQGYIPLLPLGLALSFCILCAVMGRKREFGARWGVLGACFFAGALYMAVLDSLPLPLEGTYTVTAYVTGDVEIREEDGFVHTYLKDALCVDENGNSVRMDKLYWVMTAEDEDLALARYLKDGVRVRFSGKMQRPLGRMNPYGYDFRAYLEQNGVRMRISGMADLQITLHARLDFAGVMYRVREAIGALMDRIFGDMAHMPRALLLGDKNNLPDETREMFADLGIAHVLTVSGLHVSLLSAFILALLDHFALSPRWRMAVQGVFLFLYCAMLEFAVPVVRASLLMMLLAYRRVIRRYGDPLTQLAAVFWVVLLFSPRSLFSLSFQMTFGAALGMVMIRPGFENLTENWPAWLRRLDFGTAISATLGVLIPLFNAFHRVSLIGLVVSPLAVLLSAVLLPVLLVITLVGAVYLPLGQMLAKALWFLTGWMTNGMAYLAKLPYAAVNVPAIPWMLALALVYVIFLCTRFTLLRGMKRLLAGLAAVTAALVLWLLTRTTDVCYIQLYAGQADCAVVLDRGETVVIDTGTNGNDLADLLLSEGRKADTLILTHLHSDHAGGVEELLDAKVEIGRVLIPKLGESQQIDAEGEEALFLLREKGIPVVETGAGDSILLPGGRIDFVWPVMPRAGQDPNVYCLCAVMELEGVRFLLTGDLTGAYESYVAQQADVLKVSHHGSADSSREAFLDTVSPAVAIIPCAPGRTLPSEDTLARLNASGTQILRTDKTGAVTILTDNGNYTVKTYLNQRKQHAAQ